MSRETTRRIMESHMRALVDGGDLVADFSPEVVVLTVDTGDRAVGPDAARRAILELHTEMFDAPPRILRSVLDDGFAMTEMVLVGRHIGTIRELPGGMADIPPTGVMVNLPYSVAYDVGDAGIGAIRAYVPVSALIGQLLAGKEGENDVS